MRAIRRAEVITRARTWSEAPRRYSQDDNDPESGYRLDCSGFVSMVWNLHVPGLTTVELPDLCVQVTVDELETGDVMMIGGPGTEGGAGHVILFQSWVNREHTRFWAFEQVPAGTRHHVRELPPSPPYLFYRYEMIQE